jgi:hypothetical protein
MDFRTVLLVVSFDLGRVSNLHSAFLHPGLDLLLRCSRYRFIPGLPGHPFAIRSFPQCSQASPVHVSLITDLSTESSLRSYSTYILVNLEADPPAIF